MQGCLFGIEFSGYSLRNKRRMMGLSLQKAKSLATVIHADEDYTWEVPSSWSMREAATVPMAYCTAYLALVLRAAITPKDTVLIHSASEAVGQAALTLALSAGCKVRGCLL